MKRSRPIRQGPPPPLSLFAAGLGGRMQLASPRTFECRPGAEVEHWPSAGRAVCHRGRSRGAGRAARHDVVGIAWPMQALVGLYIHVAGLPVGTVALAPDSQSRSLRWPVLFSFSMQRGWQRGCPHGLGPSCFEGEGGAAGQGWSAAEPNCAPPPQSHLASRLRNSRSILVGLLGNRGDPARVRTPAAPPWDFRNTPKFPLTWIELCR